MKDEIKEILELKRRKIENVEAFGLTSINIQEDKTLLDYITTLQEENQRLREHILRKDKVYSDLEDKYLELKEEKERLNNIIKEIRELADKYEMGKYDYNVPSFEIKEILDKENVK